MFSKGDVVQVFCPGNSFDGLIGEVIQSNTAFKNAAQVKFFFHATQKTQKVWFNWTQLRRV